MKKSFIAFCIFSFVVLAFTITVDMIFLFSREIPPMLYIGNTFLWLGINMRNSVTYRSEKQKKKFKKKLEEIGWL